MNQLPINITKYLCIITSIIGTGIILSHGPTLQAYIVKIITSHEASIYSSAYGEGLIQIPKLETWLQDNLLSTIFLCATPLAIALTKAQKARDAFIGISILAFISTTIHDLLNTYRFRDIEYTPMMENYIFNILGAPIIAIICISLLKVSLFISTGSEHSKIKAITGITTPLVIGLLFSIASYYSVLLFYKPTDARFDIAISPPISGYYSSTNTPKKEQPFGVLDGKSKIEGDLTIVAPSGNLKTNITTNTKSDTSVSITLFSGCQNHELKSQDYAKHTITLRNVKTISIKNDDGPTDIYINNIDGKVDFSSKNINHINIEKDENSKYEVTRFSSKIDNITDPGTLNYSPSILYGELYFGISLFKSKNETETRTANRSLRIETPERVYTATFSSKQLDPNAKPKCEAIDASILAKYGFQKFLEVDAIAGAQIKINKRKTDYDLFDKNELLITTSGIEGWLQIKEIPPAVLKNAISKGNVDTLVIQQGLTSLLIDKTEIPIKSRTTLSITEGELFSYPTDNENIRFYGTAKIAHKDQERINKTRWEKLDDFSKSTILGIVGILTLKLLAIFYGWIKDNEDLYT